MIQNNPSRKEIIRYIHLGWRWAFEYMEENLRIREDDILGTSETLIIQLILLGYGRA